MINISCQIEKSLKSHDFATAIGLVRGWLSDCQSGKLSELLEALPSSMRAQAILLIRDVLSRYPNTILGCPLMVCATSTLDTKTQNESSGFQLPIPTFENIKPSADLHFIGWLPCDVQLPVTLPIRAGQHQTRINWNMPTATVAMFRSNFDAIEANLVEIKPEWWGEVFGGALNEPALENIRIEGKLLINYPDAVEIASAMQAGARSEPLPKNSLFQADIGWAFDLGTIFSEKCMLK